MRMRWARLQFPAVSHGGSYRRRRTLKCLTNQKQKEEHREYDHKSNSHSRLRSARIGNTVPRHRRPATLSSVPRRLLGWPSTPGETYIVQWRPTLDPRTPWVTLTNSLPADWTSSWTTFVDSNRVQCASAGTNSFSGGGGPPPIPDFAVMGASTSPVSEPLAMPADGSGSPVPLCIYPPGFDLSGFIIFDPSTGQWVSGSGYTISQPSLHRRQPDDPQPQDGSVAAVHPLTPDSIRS